MALVTGCINYWKLDESSGNAADSVGGNTLTNTNVTYGTGIINNGAVFDATTDVLSGSEVDWTTINFWYYYASPTNSRVFFANASPDNAFQTSGSGNLLIWDNTTNRNFASSPVSGAWTMVTLVYTGTGYSLYTNGSFVQTITSGKIYFDKIGRSGNSPTATMDEFGCWNRDLSSAEITELYNSGAGLQYPFAGTPVFKNFLGFAGI